MARLACTLPNMAIVSVLSSTSAKFYPFAKGDRKLFLKVWLNIVIGTPILFTSKTGVDETHSRKSTNVFKPIAGIDASQLYPHSK